MRTFNYDEIDTIWQQKAKLASIEAGSLVKTFEMAQPAVFSYLLSIDDDVLTDEERRILFFTGTLIWHTVNELEPNSLPELSPVQLIEKEQINLQMLEYLSGEPENELLSTVSKIMDNYHQNTLLQYVIEYITKEPEKNKLYNDDHTGLMVIYLKSFIDCINYSVD